MKRILLSILLFFLGAFVFGQGAPESFAYQGVARNATTGFPLSEQFLGVKIVLKNTLNNSIVYEETFGAVKTNKFGLYTLKIGTGATTDDFSTITWATAAISVQVSIDPTGGTAFVPVGGTQQLLSVPYAMYAKSSGSGGGNATDELITDVKIEDNKLVITEGTNVKETSLANYEVLPTPISNGYLFFNGTDWEVKTITSGGADDQILTLLGTDLSIEDGNSVDLSSLQDGVDDADNDASNELITGFTENSGTITITENGINHSITLPTGTTDTDNQKIDELVLDGTDLKISLDDDGEAPKVLDLSSLQDGVDDADSDASNELITSFTENSGTITITENGINHSITLPTGTTDTDNQKIDELVLDGTDLKISLDDDGEASKVLDLSSLQDGVDDADNDASNELITGFTENSGTITITENGVNHSITLPTGTTDTDNQKIDELVLDGTDLKISLDDDGEAPKVLDLSSLQDGVDDADNDASNELITAITESNGVLTFTEGTNTKSVTLPTPVNSIYTGNGTIPKDAAVSLTNNVNFDANTFYIDGVDHTVGIGVKPAGKAKLQLQATASQDNPSIKINNATNGSLNRIQFFNSNVSTTKFWEIGAQTNLADKFSGWSVNYFNGVSYRPQIVSYGDGKTAIGNNINAANSETFDVFGTTALHDALSIYNGGNKSYTFPKIDGLANQVLTSDGAGVITWETPQNSSLWLGDASKIFYATGIVGIGTNNPNASAKLDVKGNASTSAILAENSDGTRATILAKNTASTNPVALQTDGLLKFVNLGSSTSNTDVLTISGANYIERRALDSVAFNGIGSVSNKTVPIYNQTTKKFQDSPIIINGGNIGIGTSSATFPLDIRATGNIRGAYVETNTPSSTSSKIGLTGVVTGGAGTGANKGLVGNAINGTGGDNIGVEGFASGGTGVNYGIKGIVSGGSQRFAGYFSGGKVYSSGDVGIGTQNPTEKLEVAGDVKVNHNNNFSTGGLFIHNSTYSGDPFHFYQSSTGEVRLYSDATTQVMEIDTDNQMGLGTNAPNSRLHIDATTASEDGLRVQIGGATKLVVKNNGGVNIGSNSTSTPDNGLHLTGELNTSTTGTANMLPIAYGSFSSSGATLASSGNISVTRLGEGRYSVTVTGHTLSNTIRLVTADGNSFNVATTNGGTVYIRHFTSASYNDGAFSIVIYKP